MQNYLIALTEERKKASLEELKKVGIEPVIFPAIVPAPGVVDIYGQTIRRKTQLAQYGSFASHFSILLDAMFREHEIISIFEDDIEILDGFAQFDFPHCSWDMLYYFKAKRVQESEDPRFYRVRGTPLCHAYCVKKEYIRFLVRHIWGLHHFTHIDLIYEKLGREYTQNHFCTKSHQVIQKPGYSHTKGKLWRYFE